MNLDPSDISLAAASLLAESGMPGTTVEIVGGASAGATRATLFVQLQSDPEVEPTPAVLQVSAASDERSRAHELSLTDEAALIGLAAEQSVSTPQVLAATNAAPGLGCPMIICSHIDGETIPRRVLRLVEGADMGATLAGQCGDALARIHRIDETRVPSSIARPAPDDVAPSYAARLGEMLDDLGLSNPALRYGVRWLAAHPPPPPDRLSLIHGDFRNGNLIVNDHGLAAVIDWELAHLGDPMEDAAYLCLRTWRFGNDDLPVGGFAPLEVARAAYVAAGGAWRAEAFQWWMLARTTWWGLGLAGQAAAFANGVSTSIVHAASGRRVVELEHDLLQLIHDWN